MEYEVWHDEHKGITAADEYWHGILFVPLDKKTHLINSLKAVRCEHEARKGCLIDEVKFSGCLKKPQNAAIVRDNLSVFSQSLITKPSKCGIKLQKFEPVGRHRIYENYFSQTEAIGCKFVLFRVPNNHKELDLYGLSYPERVETSFRMAFKSGLNFLIQDKICINGFYFDGYEHHGGRISLSRIIKEISYEHVSIASNVFVCDKPRAERLVEDKLIIDLVDNVVGALASEVRKDLDPHNVRHPLLEIISRAKNGDLNKQINSRLYKTLVLSDLSVENGNIGFNNLFLPSSQLSLFD